MSLAELLVAMLLGLLIALGAAAMMVGASESYAAQEESAAIDSAGRYAIEAVTRAVRQSAWRDRAVRSGGDASGPASLAGLDAHSLPAVMAGLSSPESPEANGSDVLAVHFAGAADGSVVDCAGFATETEGWSIFYVARSEDGETELRCKYKGDDHWSSDAVVRGVDSFQLLYGIDTDGDGSANAFINADAVEALDASLMLVGATPEARSRDLQRRTHWKKITSIKVALLLHGARATRKQEAPRSYQLFGPGYSGKDQGVQIDERDMPDNLRLRERRLFTSTITLRNQDAP